MSIKEELQKVDDKAKWLEQQLPWWRRYGRFTKRSFWGYQVGHILTWFKADSIGYGVFKKHLVVVAAKQAWVHAVVFFTAVFEVIHELASPV